MLESNILSIVDKILVNDEPNLIIPIIHANSTIIVPFDATNRHKPDEVWSKAGTNDPLHGGWHPYLEKFGIENWDFDYGKGLVFT